MSEPPPPRIVSLPVIEACALSRVTVPPEPVTESAVPAVLASVTASPKPENSTVWPPPVNEVEASTRSMMVSEEPAPPALVAWAVRVCTPSAEAVTVVLQAPEELAVVVPRNAAPS